MIKVSDYIIKRLEETGVKHMFMLPGGGAMHLNDSLGKSKKIQFVSCLHEQVCSIAAEAYARVTNNIGLLMVTTGPGGTNAITGVTGAYIESTPMFVVSGQVKLLDMKKTKSLRQQGMQEVDIISIVKSITKYAEVVSDAKDIKRHMDIALYLATHGRKGPVWLDIPLDIQASMIDEDNLIGVSSEELKKFDVIFDEDIDKFVDIVIDKLNNSKRPVILAGNGIRLSGGIEDFKELVKVLGIPILTTWNGIDLIESDEKLFYGRPGGLGNRFANFIQQNADLYISIGARLNLLQTGYNFDGFANKAYKVQVDIDREELKKTNVRPDMPICIDAKIFIEKILEKKSEIKIDKNLISSWLKYCDEVKNEFPILDKKFLNINDKVNTYTLVDTISKYLKEDMVYVSGSSGSCIDISMQAFRVKKGQRVFCTKGLASMGYGLPSTIGAALASGKMVASVQGDGGFVMNIQDLETIKRLNLPIKIFVLNNDGYGAIKSTQRNLFNENYVDCDRNSGLSIPDIENIVKAFGIGTLVINNNDELDDKVKKALSDDVPMVIVCKTDINLTAFPKQVSRKNEKGQMESLTLDFMNPPIDESLQKKYTL